MTSMTGAQKPARTHRWYDQARLVCDNKKSDLQPDRSWYASRTHYTTPPTKPTATAAPKPAPAPSGKGGKAKGASASRSGDGGLAAKFAVKFFPVRNASGTITGYQPAMPGKLRKPDDDYTFDC